MSPVRALLVWLACALAGTCTLGVVALERAAEPLRPPRVSTPRVALIELGAKPAAADALDFWERSAHDAELRAERVSAARLSDVPAERFAVWLLAGQVALSDADWSALEAFARRGGGIVLAGSVGLRDADGNERERLPLRRFFPGHDFELRAGEPGELRVGSRGPLAAGLAPGERIPLARGGSYLATTTGGALAWGADARSGAVLVGLHRGAPAIWLGCEAGWFASPGAARRLAVNALRYAAREALVDVQPWPGGATSAALLAIDAGGELDLARRAVLDLLRSGVPPLVALTPESAEADPRAARELAELVEVAVALLDGVAATDARARLARAAGREVRGAVVQAELGAELDPAHFEFAALGPGASDAPGLAPAGVVALPRTAAMPPADADEAERIEALLAGLGRSVELGGMYHVLLPPDWVVKGRLQLAELLAAQLRARGVWIAGAGELARWWRERLGVEAEIAMPRASELLVSARNAGTEPARGVTLRIYLPAGSQRPALERPRFASRPLVRYASSHTWMELVLPDLDPGESVEYTLTF